VSNIRIQCAYVCMSDYFQETITATKYFGIHVSSSGSEAVEK